MSVDVIRTSALEEAARYASTPFQREHVIPVFFDAGVFRVSLIDLGLDRASLACSFSIDTEDDARRAEHLLACAGEDADLAALVAAGANR